MIEDSVKGDDTAPAGRGRAAGGGVLHRLLRARNQSRKNAGEAPGMPQQVPGNPARAAAIAVSRAAQGLYGLPVRPLSIVPDGITLAEMAELLPESALFAVVEGSGEALGVVAMDPAAVTALIEVQALGRITNRPIENRRRTRSDALICAEFVNRMLTEFEADMADLDGFESFGGFRYASHLDDPRPLLLLLEDVGYRCLRMKLAMGDDNARRETQILVALPERRPVAALPTPASIAQAAPAIETTAAPTPQSVRDAGIMAQFVQHAPVDLIGVLCRRQVSLGELRALAPGKLLSLPRVSLHDARLETRQGQLVAQGKLGEADGSHAIRLRQVAGAASAAPKQLAAPDHFTTHILAEPKLRAVTGPASVWRPGEVVGEPAADPMIGDLSDPDRFRTETVADIVNFG